MNTQFKHFIIGILALAIFALPVLSVAAAVLAAPAQETPSTTVSPENLLRQMSEELENAAKYKNVTQDKLPVSWSASDRFVRSDFFLRHLPKPRDNDAPTAYGFMYSALATSMMPAGLPAPAEDKAVAKKLVAAPVWVLLVNKDDAP